MITNKKTISLFFILCVTFSILMISANGVKCGGPFNYNATDDSTTYQHQADTAIYETSPTGMPIYAYYGYIQYLWLNFNLSAISGLPIQNATLYIFYYSYNPTKPASNTPINGYYAGSSWIGSTITYNNEPTITAISSASTTFGSGDPGRWIALNVTDYIKSIANGSKTFYGLVIGGGDDATSQFFDRVFNAPNAHIAYLSIYTQSISNTAKFNSSLTITDTNKKDLAAFNNQFNSFSALSAKINTISAHLGSFAANSNLNLMSAINALSAHNALFNSDLAISGSFLGLGSHYGLFVSDLNGSSIISAIQTILPKTTAQSTTAGGGAVLLIIVALMLIIRERNKTTSYKK
jgi:hypothetical protein